jgi:hypothetical protein
MREQIFSTQEEKPDAAAILDQIDRWFANAPISVSHLLHGPLERSLLAESAMRRSANAPACVWMIKRVLRDVEAFYQSGPPPHVVVQQEKQLKLVDLWRKYGMTRGYKERFNAVVAEFGPPPEREVFLRLIGDLLCDPLSCPIRIDAMNFFDEKLQITAQEATLLNDGHFSPAGGWFDDAKAADATTVKRAFTVEVDTRYIDEANYAGFKTRAEVTQYTKTNKKQSLAAAIMDAFPGAKKFLFVDDKFELLPKSDEGDGRRFDGMQVSPTIFTEYSRVNTKYF